MKKFPAIIVTCEHARATIPPVFRSVFPPSGGPIPVDQVGLPLLLSHRAWDLGALPAARHVAQFWQAPLLHGIMSRLVCDLNRPPHHPKVWSEWTRQLPKAQKQELLALYHQSYWRVVHQAILHGLEHKGRVLHLSIHSFTPIWKKDDAPTVPIERDVDLGLLYNPSRPLEKKLATHMLQAAPDVMPGLRVRRNQPYEGKSSSLVQQLRLYLPTNKYIAMEIEFNQALLRQGPLPAQAFCELVQKALTWT